MTITTGTGEIGREFIETTGYGTAGKYAVITFSDTGGGISEEIREKVFEPFFTTKEIGKGTGLGLSMVYGITKQHNGFVDFTSEPGKGTVFTIHLPLAEAGAKDKRPEFFERPEGGKETILLAEDEPEVREIIKTVLEEFGYTVVVAVDGAEAVERYTENKESVRLIIMDVIMPKKSGQDAYEEIRHMGGDVKALFVSGYATERMRELGALTEDMEFLRKPVIPSALLKKVREVLDR